MLSRAMYQGEEETPCNNKYVGQELFISMSWTSFGRMIMARNDLIMESIEHYHNQLLMDERGILSNLQESLQMLPMRMLSIEAQ